MKRKLRLVMPPRRPFLLALLVALLTAASASAGVPKRWLDQSQAIFFPRELGERLESYGSFPLTWWGFLTFDARDEGELPYARETCRALRNGASDLLLAAECDEDLGAYLPLLQAWARDLVVRAPMPAAKDLTARLDGALAKASLPLDRTLLSILRFDPLETYRELRQRVEKRNVIPFPRRAGVFFDPDAKRVIVPVKLAFPPPEGEKTAALRAKLDASCGSAEACARWGMIGAHASTLENQRRIRDDMGAVSVVGALLLVALLVAVVVIGRWRLLFMVPVVFSAVGLSALATVALFGSIHGLTLSFGTGIVGLALDYGLHRALNAQAYVWRSNFFGLLTTVSALLILTASEIPLLRQMMAFSAMGIVLAFVLLYLANAKLGILATVEPYRLAPRPTRATLALTLVLMLGAPVGLFTLKPSFDLAGFNYQTEHTRALMTWFFRTSRIVPPLFRVSAGGTEALEDAHRARVWSERNGIEMESVASFLPRVPDQRAALASWVGEPCGNRSPAERFARGLTTERRKFFAPFLDGLQCEGLGPRGENSFGLPPYAADFAAGGKWISLFFPKGDEVGLVKAHYPDATSLRELVERFPRTLGRELRWMGPLSFVVVWLVLFLYYRRVSLTLLAFVPFFTGAGLAAWASLLFGLPVSFVSLVGLVMLYGLSVDYGIFATDAARTVSADAVPGAWTAIAFAALATISGFLPLLFCKHQVLAQLGQVLTLGTLGTVLGAFWGVPALASRFRARGLA